MVLLFGGEFYFMPFHFEVLLTVLQTYQAHGRIFQTSRPGLGWLRRFFAGCQRPAIASYAY